LVPLCAFDRRAHRLGYGRGYYDRALAALAARGPVLSIGLAFAAQEVDRVPTEAHDQGLDYIVTETAILAGKPDPPAD
jgi:5-formyltetrahydrofolate cyclo-ligase